MSEQLEESVVLEKLTQLFERLGAERGAAARMASQLWKRSAQIAQERDVKQVVALDRLIKLTISGSQGDVLPE